MEQEDRSVRLVVVGSQGCGKTSLITTLVSSIFPESVPAVMQQVQVPPEETNDGIALCITDTSSDLADRDVVLKEVSQADVVILVYSVADQNAFPDGLDGWLKQITGAFKGPVVVVGNKVDAVVQSGGDRSAALRSKSKALLDKYGKQVDIFWECSAKLNMNVSEVFNVAQHAVLYPLWPLFDTQTKELRPKFKVALCRVFRVFDLDHDGFLSDKELNDFQETCFGVRLQPTDITEVKAVLQRQGSGLVSARGITMEGFQFINKEFINSNRAETPWLILRQFGYQNNLDVKLPEQAYTLERQLDQSVELSTRAVRFLKDVFRQFDRKSKGFLTAEEVAEIFSVCPCQSNPWEKSAASDLNNMPELFTGIRSKQAGTITLEGWISLWAMGCLLQPEVTLINLHYLGVNMSAKQLTHVTRSRAIEDEQNDVRRVVLRGFVFGTEQAGKSTLLNAMINQKSKVGGGVRSACSAVKPRNIQLSSKNSFQSTHLVLTEIPTDQSILDEALTTGIHQCDLAVMLFDSGDDASVEYLRNIQRHIPDTVPCVYMYDDAANTVALAQALALCNEHSLPPPEAVCFDTKQSLRLERKLELLMTTALRPDVARPISSQRRAARRRKRYLNAAVRISLVSLVVVSTAWFTWSIMDRYDSPKDNRKRL